MLKDSNQNKELSANESYENKIPKQHLSENQHKS